MIRQFTFALTASSTAAALAAFVSLGVLFGLAAVPRPPSPTLADLGWVPCERTLAGVWICERRLP